MDGFSWISDDNADLSNFSTDLGYKYEELQSLVSQPFFDLDGSKGGFGSDPHLICACQNNDIHSAKLLLEFKANPNIVGADGRNALNHQLTTSTPEWEIITLLLDYDANIFALDFNHKTSIDCLKGDNYNIFKDLVIKHFQQSPEGLYKSFPSMMDALTYSAEKRNFRFVSEVLSILESSNRLDIFKSAQNPTDRWRSSRSLLSSLICTKPLNQALVKQFISLSVDNEILSFFRDRNGYSSLHHAISLRAYDLVELMLQRLDHFKGNFNLNNFKTESVLHTAARCNAYMIIDHLVELGIRMDLQTIVEHSKEEYPQVGALFADTPFHIAARKGNVEFLKICLKYDKSLVEKVNFWGNIPLHVVMMSKSLPAVELLLSENGCQQVKVKNKDGLTPMDYFKKHWKTKDRSYAKVLNLLNQYSNPPKIEKEDDLDEDKLCKLCMDQAIDAIFLPCGHQGTCLSCAQASFKSAANCPFCKQPVENVIKVFFQ